MDTRRRVGLPPRTTAATAVTPGTTTSRDGPDGAAVVAAAVSAVGTGRAWRLVARGDHAELRLGDGVPGDRRVLLDAGSALFTLRRALRDQGVRSTCALLPRRDDPALLALVRAAGGEPPPRPAVPLPRPADRGRSSRATRVGAVPLSALHRVVYAAGADGGYLRLLSDPAAAAAAQELVDRAEHRPAGRDAPRPRPDDPTPALAVLLSAGDRPADLLGTGQALRHAVHTAAGLGLAASVHLAPAEVPELRAELARLAGGGLRPQLVLRFAIGGGRRSGPIDRAVRPPANSTRSGR